MKNKKGRTPNNDRRRRTVFLENEKNESLSNYREKLWILIYCREILMVLIMLLAISLAGSALDILLRPKQKNGGRRNRAESFARFCVRPIGNYRSRYSTRIGGYQSFEPGAENSVKKTGRKRKTAKIMTKLNEHRYRIYVTEKHLHLIKSAVDLYSRLLAGQFENPLWNTFVSRDVDYESFHEQCAALKQIVFPELSRHSSYGVGWQDGVNQQNNSQIGYEIEAMIAHELWKRETNRSDVPCRATTPLHYSTEALIRVEDIKPVLLSTDELLHEAGRRILINAFYHFWSEAVAQARQRNRPEVFRLAEAIQAILIHLKNHFDDGEGLRIKGFRIK